MPNDFISEIVVRTQDGKYQTNYRLVKHEIQNDILEDIIRVMHERLAQHINLKEAQDDQET